MAKQANNNEEIKEEVVNNEEETVTIMSTMNIAVTNGLSGQNVTVDNDAIENRLKVIPTWQKEVVQITKGKNKYPAKIKDWFTVQKLVKVGILNFIQE